MLGRQLDSLKWSALVVLVCGVSLVQVSGLKDSSGGKSNNLTGLVCVLLACCSSGFAGVYFEKVLKGSEVSVWVRNIELALIGIFVGLVGVYYADAEMVTELGFFYGYSRIVCAVICLQAFGGIIVAVVVKYADNLLKGFATSISIVISCLLSIYLFADFTLSFKFFIGTKLVILSTMLYSTTPASLHAIFPFLKLEQEVLPQTNKKDDAK
jgi:solute carrier family 35 (UDP-sugar transporter), member A1/2/3